ncbi:MAG TPA: dynamin family protein [Vicinamibacterales bacterium]|nr:dynamin family protein [Vicinamibacterales bacterium]
MLTRILDPAQQELVRDERRVLGALRSGLIRFGASDDSVAPLERSIEQLDELFLLVVVGEFNAGKSAFVNALVGERVMDEGVTPTTAHVTLLQYGDQRATAAVEPHLTSISAPAEILRDIHIVDTPGTNAIIREHERITAGFVPRADLVLFVTSADRPFTETERAFLEQIRDWGKKVVVVINKIDIIASEHDRAEVQAYVADNARRLLGTAPEIFAVSARDAFRAKHGEPALWTPSGFEPLERYIRSTLDQAARVKLKLLNPIGVGTALAQRYRGVTRGRLALLEGDFALLEDVETELRMYEDDMTREFAGRMAVVDNVLLEMERRGRDFFEDTMRIGRMFDLLNRARVQQAFEQQVVADAPQRIEQRVQDLVDWLVESDHRQWERITRHLEERRREHRERIVGDTEARVFHDERRRLIESIGREAQEVVDTYDRRREAIELADGARNAVAAAAAAGAGAVGLGAIVTVAATTAAADVTGIILAGVIATIGFFIIPARRTRGKAEMRRKIADVRERLSGALRGQFEQAIAHSLERLRDGIAPYSRFVRSEGEKLRQTDAQLEQLSADLERLRTRVDALAA